MLLLVFRSLLADAGKIEGSFVARHSSESFGWRCSEVMRPNKNLILYN